MADMNVHNDGKAIAVLAAIALGALILFSNVNWINALITFVSFVLFSAIYLRLIKPRPDDDFSGKTRQSLSYVTRKAELDLINLMTDPVIMLDSVGRIEIYNRAAQRHLRLSRPGERLETQVRVPEVSALVEQALTGKAPDPVMISPSAMEDTFFNVYAIPFQNQQAGLNRIVLMFRDETETQRAATLRADFLANASHELRTPVASMLGYIETLRGHAKDDPAAQDKFLGIMQTQAERMQRLIADLLSLSRIEQGQHRAPETEVSLKHAVGSALDAVRPLAKSRGVKIALNGSEAMVLGDSDELVQLTLNLVDNAIKVLSKGRTVTVSITPKISLRPGGEFSGLLGDGAPQSRIVALRDFQLNYALLRISDNGPGFAREHLPRIGERFYRIAGDRKGPIKGTGLGIAIVKHITKRHRGGLMVESVQGEGTVFSIYLPIND